MRGKKLISLGIVLVMAISVFGCSLLGGQKKTSPSPTRTRFTIDGFYVNEQGGNDSFPSLKLHAAMLDEINPLWYHVNPDGSLEEEPNKEAIAFAKSQKVKINPLVNVVPNQDTVLRDPKARDNAINNLLRVVKENNYDGIDIDFEFVPSTGQTDFRVDRTELATFMKMLYPQMKKMGKEVHMCVLPKIGVSPEMHGVYDYSMLAPYVDKVTVMVYDHSQEGSPPGPLAPFNWVEQNVKTALKQGFKPKQLCLGVATYGYDWPAGKSGGFTSPSKKIMQEAPVKGHQIKWSDKYQEPYYIYKTPEGVEREVWFENANTLKTKLRLAEKYKLSGVCIWRLGFEDPKFWAVLEKQWGKRR